MRMSQRVRAAQGKVAIVKPGKIRWDYMEPDRQVLVSDGEKFFMYFEKTSQMMVRSVDEYIQSDVTYAFFSGSGNIIRDFEVFGYDPAVTSKDSSEGNNKDYVLKLVPKKPHSQIEFLVVWVDTKKFLVNHLQIVDLFGNTTDIYFSKFETDKSFPHDFFTFSPPPDTEIIEQF